MTEAKKTDSGGKRTQRTTPRDKAPAPRASSRKAVTYSEPRPMKDFCFTMDISGREATGKSHVVRTFPGDILWIETPEEWGKTDPMINKFKYVYKDETNVKLLRAETFDDIRKAITQEADNGDIKTIAIDSGTELRSLAAEEWMQEEGKRKGKTIHAVHPPTQWQYPNRKIEKLITDAKKTHKYIVVTNRMADEYIGDKSTGRKIRSGYKWIPYDFHIVLEIEWGIRNYQGKQFLKQYKFAKVKKNFMWGIDEDTNLNYGKPYLFNVSFKGIQEELMKPWGPHPAAKSMDICVEEAQAWIAKMFPEEPKPEKKSR